MLFTQDAGALGAVAEAGQLAPLSEDAAGPGRRALPRHRPASGSASAVARAWSPTTPRRSARRTFPTRILDFTDPAWSGRIGWAPTNGSFQAFVTALRVLEGEDAAREWLEGIQANDPMVYDSNAAALEGVAAGEVDVAFINHYYLHQRLAEDPDTGGRQPLPDRWRPRRARERRRRRHPEHRGEPDGGGGASSTTCCRAEAQAYFASETYEYPLIEGVATDPALPALSEIGTPEIDLSELSDLEGTLELLGEVGVL